MKLRNKKTGKIVDFGYLQTDHISSLVLTTYENGCPEMSCYNSLAEVNAEWEDYEEQKEYWYIDPEGTIICEPDDEAPYDNYRKQIGNYFETKEEAEKAVEKLKAWKRLKDAGYYFTRDAIEEGSKHKFILRLGCEQEKIMTTVAECKSNYSDLKILFRSEKEMEKENETHKH